jgi:pimeloyl-ACP methyl ester carboxylesterase
VEAITLHNGARKFSARFYGQDNSGPVVLCLHGFPDNANSFHFQIDDFVAAGYRVLIPTLRGYEPSSITADADYYLASLAQDVFAWLDELHLDKVHLVGHDWGAAIAYAASAIAPDRFLSLTTMAVPHPARFIREGLAGVPLQILKSWYMFFNQIPVLSDYLIRQGDWQFIRFLRRRWSPDQVLTNAQWSDLCETFSQPGVVKAMLSYYRQNASLPLILGFRHSIMSDIKKILVPNLAITGANDGCVDTRVFDYAVLAKDYPRGFRVERVEDAGHFVHQENPAAVNFLIISWLTSNS